MNPKGIRLFFYWKKSLHDFKKKVFLKLSLNSFEGRSWLVTLFFTALFLVVWLRAFYLHMVPDPRVLSLINTQYKKRVAIRAKRGFIYDRNKEELAISRSVNSIFAVPRKIEAKNVPKVVKALSKTLKVSPRSLRKKLSSRKNFIWIKRQVSDDMAYRVQQYNLPHVHMVKESKRFYPNSSLAGQIIGFTDIDSKGLEGLEVKYDKYLQGEKVSLTIDRDAHGRRLLLGNDTGDLLNKQGASLILTIDKNIQYFTEKTLIARVKETGAKSGCAMVMDPFDGRILAMANVPTFDPNHRTAKTLKFKKNRCITDTFEPGSTFKPFIVAAALEKKALSLKEKINCENGVYKIGKRRIRDDHPYDYLTPLEVIRSSSNIGTYKIARRIGKVRTYDYIRKFGFSKRTRIDLNGEALGILHTPNTWKEIRFSNIAFGQGLSVTPLQMITAYSVFANGGFVIRPHLVDKIISNAGDIIYSYKHPLPNKAISATTSKNLANMLEAVVYHPKGTGKRARIEGYKVAGKTGTSEKYDPAIKGYSPNKRIASFIGFAPTDNPRVIVYVVIDEPDKKYKYGGVAAAPAFAEITKNTLNYLGVMPKSTKGETIAEFNLGSPLKSASSELKKSIPLPIVAETTEPLIEVKENSIVLLNVKGYTVRRVLKELSGLPVQVKLKGHGIIQDQHPAAGSTIKPGTTLTLIGNKLVTE